MAEERHDFYHPIIDRRFRELDRTTTPLGIDTTAYKGDTILIGSYLNRLCQPFKAVIGREHDRRLNENNVTISKVSSIEDEDERKEIEEILRSEGIKVPIYFW